MPSSTRCRKSKREQGTMAHEERERGRRCVAATDDQERGREEGGARARGIWMARTLTDRLW